MTKKIEFSSHAFEDDYNLQRFDEIFQEKIDLLTAQIFSALDKGIKGNRIRTGVKEGKLTSYITVKTAPHKEPPILILGDENAPQEEDEEAEHIFK